MLVQCEHVVLPPDEQRSSNTVLRNAGSFDVDLPACGRARFVRDGLTIMIDFLATPSFHTIPAGCQWRP